MEVTLKFKKKTANTRVYEEVENDMDLESVVPTLYVRTEALMEEFDCIPEELIITISEP